MYCNLDFLPAGPVRKLMILAVPALSAVNITYKRFMEIVEGSPPTDEEEDLMTWAYDLLEMILLSNAMRGTNEEIEAKQVALEIAHEELDEKRARKVIRKIRQLIDKIEKEGGRK